MATSDMVCRWFWIGHDGQTKNSKKVLPSSNRWISTTTLIYGYVHFVDFFPLLLTSFSRTCTINWFNGPSHTYQRDCILSLPISLNDFCFTLLSILLLHRYTELQHPIVEEETKRFNTYCLFFCCAGNPLFILATVPVSGYTPGQMINIDLELNNTSNENVSAFSIQIIRVGNGYTMCYRT